MSRKISQMERHFAQTLHDNGFKGVWMLDLGIKYEEKEGYEAYDVKKMCGFRLLMESLMSVWSLSPLLNFLHCAQDFIDEYYYVGC